MNHLLIDSHNSQTIQLNGNEISNSETADFMQRAYLIDGYCNIVNADMPIKQVRQIKKALPFALEEQLASEIEDNHLHFLGKNGSTTYAAVISHVLMERIKLDHTELTELYFLPLCLPMFNDGTTILLLKGQALIRFGEFEACSVPLPLLIPALEKHEVKAISLIQDDADYGLVRSQMESHSYDIKDIPLTTLSDHLKNKQENNLLSGQYQVVVKQVAGKSNKLKLPLALAASIFCVSLGLNWLQSAQYGQMAQQVQQASKSFYKSLFPDERIRGIRRQFRDKLEEAGGGNASAGAVSFTNLLAATGQAIRKEKDLALESIRYNQKKSQAEFEILATSIEQLDKLKQNLEQSSFKVEIASANNVANSKVKGVIKVSQNG